MKKVLASILILTIAFCAIGCSNRNEITKDDIVDKVYVYEKEGCGGDFTIEIKADGTFTYGEGLLSSHIGMGEWSYSEGVLTLKEKTARIIDGDKMEYVVATFNFSVEKDTLIFIENGADNFRYVKVKDGDKFFVQ